MNLDAFPRHPLLFGPSPVHRLDRLTAHLGGATLWAKREDCNSGLAYGGNKTRKLEYLVADAQAQGCDTLVSTRGSIRSHEHDSETGHRHHPRVRAQGPRGRVVRLSERAARPHHGRLRA